MNLLLLSSSCSLLAPDTTSTTGAGAVVPDSAVGSIDATALDLPEVGDGPSPASDGTADASEVIAADGPGSEVPDAAKGGDAAVNGGTATLHTRALACARMHLCLGGGTQPWGPFSKCVARLARHGAEPAAFGLESYSNGLYFRASKVLPCLADATTCDAVRSCIFAMPPSGNCPVGSTDCAGNTFRHCLDVGGGKSGWLELPCGEHGLQCALFAFGCNGGWCDAKTAPKVKCAGGVQNICTTKGLRPLDCAPFGLARFDIPAGSMADACMAGAGASCSGDSYTAPACKGSVSTWCGYGKSATTDCAKYGMICGKAVGFNEWPQAGCRMPKGPESCAGTMLTYHGPAGVAQFDCKLAGATGCAVTGPASEPTAWCTASP